MQRWGPGGPYAGPCPAVHGDAARPRGGRDRPPYIAAENGQRSVNGSRLQRPTAGYAGGGWRPGGCGGPEGPCPRVSQGVWRPGECGDPEGYLQGQVRHPSVACGDTSPCRGGFRGGSHTERLPCKGSWMRRKAQTEGCIAGWRWKYPARSGRTLPYVSQRAVLASSPQTLRRPAVPGFAARAPYIVGRAFTPAGEEVAAAGAGWALCQRLAPQRTAVPQGPAAGEIARPTLRPKTGGNP